MKRMVDLARGGKFLCHVSCCRSYWPGAFPADSPSFQQKAAQRSGTKQHPHRVCDGSRKNGFDRHFAASEYSLEIGRSPSNDFFRLYPSLTSIVVETVLDQIPVCALCSTEASSSSRHLEKQAVTVWLGTRGHYQTGHPARQRPVYAHSAMS
jgi:hypothetical protein